MTEEPIGERKLEVIDGDGSANPWKYIVFRMDSWQYKPSIRLALRVLWEAIRRKNGGGNHFTISFWYKNEDSKVNDLVDEVKITEAPKS